MARSLPVIHTVTLAPLSEKFEATRKALHEVAQKTVSPARLPESEISLRQTPGGFGTPWFWDKAKFFTQVRVDGAELVTDREGNETIEKLDVDESAARQLGDWYEFAATVLGRVMHECGEPGKGKDDLLLRLWPEHFDLAFDYATEEEDSAATYGASPGDNTVAAPYIYVGPWKRREGELWNATNDEHGFEGAFLGYAELLEAADPYATAIDFLRVRLRELTR
jgi:hypothetical protein